MGFGIETLKKGRAPIFDLDLLFFRHQLAPTGPLCGTRKEILTAATFRS